MTARTLQTATISDAVAGSLDCRMPGVSLGISDYPFLSCMSEKSGRDRYLRTSLRMLGPGIRGYLSAVCTLSDLVAPEQSVTCFVTSFY